MQERVVHLHSWNAIVSLLVAAEDFLFLFLSLSIRTKICTACGGFRELVAQRLRAPWARTLELLSVPHRRSLQPARTSSHRPLQLCSRVSGSSVGKHVLVSQRRSRCRFSGLSAVGPISQLARRQQWTLYVKHVEFDLERNLCPVHVSRPTFANSGAVMLELDRVCS